MVSRKDTKCSFNIIADAGRQLQEREHASTTARPPATSPAPRDQPGPNEH